MKKHVVCFLLMITCFLSTACSPTHKQKLLQGSLGSAQELLTNLKSYHAVVEVNILGNKSNHLYLLEQWYKTGGKYRTQVLAPSALKEKITVSAGKKVQDYLPALGIWEEHAEYERIENEFFLDAFIERYMQTEDAAVDVSVAQDNPYMVYEVKIPGEHPYFSSEKLWLDQKKHVPYKLTLFNQNGREVVVVVFKEFEYNVDIHEELFQVK